MIESKDATTNAQPFPAGALVVSTLDGEPGRIVEPVTYNRSHTKVTSYVVLTNDGREIWEADELFVPDQQN